MPSRQPDDLALAVPSALTGNNPNLLAGSYQSRRANLATLVEFLDRSKRVLPVGKSLSGHAS